MSKTYIQPQPPRGPGSVHARQMCIDAAISIAKLLQAYEIRYTLRRMNVQGPAIVCSAALILIFADISQFGRPQGLNKLIGPFLSVCFRALDEFGQCWESANRARDFLTRLQRQWELNARSRRAARRQIGAADNSSLGSRKRPLTATDFETSQTRFPPTGPLDVPQPPLQGQIQSSEDTMGLDLDLDYDWMLAANAQAVSGNWASVPSSRAVPPNFMDFLEDV